MTSAAFWQELDRRLAPFDLLKHPYYQAWSAGELTRDDLAGYASEYFHHVSAFPTYLSALHSRLPDGELRREVLRNLTDEEGTDSPGQPPHSELWMDFATGMGATRDAVLTRDLQPETRALIAGFREHMTRSVPEALAALYAYESRVPAIAATKAAGLEQHYAADARTTRYFTLHRTADVHHAQVWRNLLDEELSHDPSAAEAALDAAGNAAQSLWSTLDGIERARLQQA